MSEIAIIGAGVAGSSAARFLLKSGHQVTLFDKGRGAGGRCSTRRFEASTYDFGAQYFTARDERFAEVVRTLARDGWVANWECRSGVLGSQGFHDIRPSVARWVGTPGMSSLVKGLQQGLDVRFESRIEALERKEEGWFLLGLEDLQGPYNAVLVTPPAPQAQLLLQVHVPALAHELEAVHYEACLAAMVELQRPSGLDFDAATVKDLDDGLGFVGRNSSKPRRPRTPEHWVLHSSIGWAQQHLGDPVLQVASRLWQAFCGRTGIEPALLHHLAGHRWRYARVSRPLGKPYLWDEAQQLGWAGDGALGPRLEAAFVSGLEAAQAMASCLK